MVMPNEAAIKLIEDYAEIDPHHIPEWASTLLDMHHGRDLSGEDDGRQAKRARTEDEPQHKEPPVPARQPPPRPSGGDHGRQAKRARTEDEPQPKKAPARQPPPPALRPRTREDKSPPTPIEISEEEPQHKGCELEPQPNRLAKRPRPNPVAASWLEQDRPPGDLYRAGDRSSEEEQQRGRSSAERPPGIGSCSSRSGSGRGSLRTPQKTVMTRHAPAAAAAEAA